MGEQEPNRREAIIHAALEVFAEVGYHQATIKQIARQANLKSPALIYWYFENKRELLHAVLMQLAPYISESTNPAALLDLLPETVLRRFVSMFFAAVDNPKARKLFRVFLSEALHSPELVDDIVQGGPIIALNALTTYFAHQVKCGNLRPHNPESSARMLIGMMLIYLLAHELMTPLAGEFPAPDAYTNDIVELFLDGLRA